MLVRLNAIFVAISVTATAGLLLALTAPTAAFGQSLIRDAEIENTIREYVTPVLRAAGLEPKNVRIHLVKDKRLNAFVAGGQRLFVTTALLQATEHPGQLTGVMAHEIGHIAGGHLARLEGAMRDARTQALIGNLLGLAAGILAQNPGAAAAGSTIGTHIATRTLLKYSRVQERSADQAAMDYLDKTRQSARGLHEFLEILSNQELLVISNQTQRRNSYTITHPLTRDRIAFVRNHVAGSPYSDVSVRADRRAMHRRIVAKLKGFLDPPARTFRTYKSTDRGIAARYARAIAYYRLANVKASLRLIDGLIRERPKDPYFWELKGQVLFENGRLADALPAYDRAVGLLPGEPLLRVSQAHAQIELNRPDLMKQALKSLRIALRAEPRLPSAWRLAAIAYGRDGQMGMSHLSSAEYNLIAGKLERARNFAGRAKKVLKRGSPGWLRAEDIIQSARAKLRKRKKGGEGRDRRKRRRRQG